MADPEDKEDLNKECSTPEKKIENNQKDSDDVDENVKKQKDLSDDNNESTTDEIIKQQKSLEHQNESSSDNIEETKVSNIKEHAAENDLEQKEEVKDNSSAKEETIETSGINNNVEIMEGSAVSENDPKEVENDAEEQNTKIEALECIKVETVEFENELVKDETTKNEEQSKSVSENDQKEVQNNADKLNTKIEAQESEKVEYAIE